MYLLVCCVLCICIVYLCCVSVVYLCLLYCVFVCMLCCFVYVCLFVCFFLPMIQSFQSLCIPITSFLPSLIPPFLSCPASIRFLPFERLPPLKGPPDQFEAAERPRTKTFDAQGAFTSNLSNGSLPSVTKSQCNHQAMRPSQASSFDVCVTCFFCSVIDLTV
ncbi:hypothetical protein B0J11DRAFT_536746 [Dendryphion nanum]|uniref:Uncharacterized protein n=1 Tax=Dendryphion nanum TaxID=256645 RepID=A0A9P9DEL7_9PLEO|nr:hypothetical protein B0J11DRAFT_536746 [Dendryphion nanum]